MIPIILLCIFGALAGGIWQYTRPVTTLLDRVLRTLTTLPESIQVRLVSYVANHPGFRSRRVTVVTTLLEETIWPDDRIAALYCQRWEIETCFDHLKTTLKMNMLKCHSVSGVQKELAMHLLAYNLVRLAMLKAASAQTVAVNRISFIDAMRWLSVRMQGLSATSRLIINPSRKARSEPRVIRQRLKAYDLMVRPRAEMKNAEIPRKHA